MIVQPGQLSGQMATLADGLHASGARLEQIQRDQVQSVKFVDYFRKANQDLYRRDQELWTPILADGLRHELYFEGHQALVPAGQGYKIKNVPERDRHRIFVVNRLRPLINEMGGVWMSINPKIDVLVQEDDPTKEQRRVDAYDALRDHLNFLCVTPGNVQSWSKHGQMHGRYIAEMWFDEDKQWGREYRYHSQMVNIPPMQRVDCLQCGEPSILPQEQVVNSCPNCFSPYIQLTPIDGIEGIEEPLYEGWERAGEVECLFRPSWCARFSLTVGAKLSPWGYVELEEVREVVEAQHGKLPRVNEYQESDDILHPGRIIRRAEVQRGLSLGTQAGGEALFVQRFYHGRDMLHFVQLEEPYECPNGEVIPANVRLSEYAAEKGGICIKTSPQLPFFLDVYPEKFQDRFVFGSYDISPGKALPRGDREAPDYQKWTNVLLSGAFDGTLKTLQPSLAVVDEVIPDGKLWNREDRTIRIKLAQLKALGENANINSALGLVPAPSINNSVTELVTTFANELRRNKGVETYMNSEDQSVDPETLGAARIAESRNSRTNSLQAANFAQFQVELFERGFEICKENYGDVRLISVSSEEKRRRIGHVLLTDDIRTAVKLYCEKDSWLPDLSVERRQAYIEAVNLYVAAQQAGLANPLFVKKINQAFNVDLTATQRNERIADCEEILQELIEQAPFSMSPAELYARNPIDPLDPEHEAKGMWWQNITTRRETRRYHPFVKLVADMYVYQHAIAYMQMRGGLAAIAAVGAGLIAPPISSGMQPGETKPPMSLNGKGEGEEKQGKQKSAQGNEPGAQPQNEFQAPNPMAAQSLM